MFIWQQTQPCSQYHQHTGHAAAHCRRSHSGYDGTHRTRHGLRV